MIRHCKRQDDMEAEIVRLQGELERVRDRLRAENDEVEKLVESLQAAEDENSALIERAAQRQDDNEDAP